MMHQFTPSHWDLLIKNAYIFDGSGAQPFHGDVAIRGGRINSIGSDLPVDVAREVIDAKGQWLMPGLLDIHTHFDLEVEVDPRLPEAVRHGTTTVVMSNCSLGVCFGKQCPPEFPEQSPIVDCFTRVENMPKRLLTHLVDKVVTWNDTEAYMQHFKKMPLGPNVVAMVPHSMLRIEAMGLEESLSRLPSNEEIVAMCILLRKALDQGFVGFPSDGLPLHYMANDPHRNAKIPAQYATTTEVGALAEVVREYNRIWQTTPNPESPLMILQTLLLTSGRLYGKPLRMTATAAMDININPHGAKAILGLSRFLNSSLMRGHFVFQALSAPFAVYADGITSPLMEEKPSLRELNAIDMENREGRKRLLNDPDYIKRFRKDWVKGKSGFNLARLRRKLKLEATTFTRELDDMLIDDAPVSSWKGQNLGDVYRRLKQFQSGGATKVCSDDQERQAFESFPNPTKDDADFMLHLLRQYDRNIRWVIITANQRPDVLKELVFHEQTLPGFNDSGAHFRNMAYYDGNLRTLKMAAQDSIELVALAVKRLTRYPAELFGLDTGSLEIGAQADLVLINPEALLQYDSEANLQMIYRDELMTEQMVNRSDGVVPCVIIAGKIAWQNNAFSENFGRERFGSMLTARDDRTVNEPSENKKEPQAA